MFTTEIILPYR